MTDILTRRAELMEELRACDTALDLAPELTDLVTARASVVEQLSEMQEQIDNGELTEAEAAQYLAEADADPFEGDDQETDAQERRRSLIHRVETALSASPEWIDVADLVEIVQGRRLTEMSAQHAAVRKVLARMAWPQEYGLDARPTVEIHLGQSSIFSEVRRIDTSP